MTGERPSEERPPWEPRTRFEMEKEINELRTLQKRLGEAVGYAVDVLLQDEDNRQNEEVLKIRERKREAVESLAYIRDVLNGGTVDVEEERLFGEDEYRRRKQEIEARQQEAAKIQEARRSGETPLVRPPEPTAAIFVTPSERRERPVDGTIQGNSHPLTALARSPPIARVSPAPLNAREYTTAALPRRQSPANPMARMSPTSTPTMQAPWNYTRSGFGGQGVKSSTLPRPPPRSSTTYRPTVTGMPVTKLSAGGDEQTSGGGGNRGRQDPLGALP